VQLDLYDAVGTRLGVGASVKVSQYSENGSGSPWWKCPYYRKRVSIQNSLAMKFTTQHILY
jgi:hypothetical protein